MADKPSKKSVALSGVVVAETALCSIDPEQGILRYRGYDIADLAEHATYEEVAYLLLEGDLPGDEELRAFEQELSQRDLPANVRTLIDGNAHDVTPLELLRTATSLLSFSDPAESAIDRCTLTTTRRCGGGNAASASAQERSVHTGVPSCPREAGVWKVR